jgi:hypothetical protein
VFCCKFALNLQLAVLANPRYIMHGMQACVHLFAADFFLSPKSGSEILAQCGVACKIREGGGGWGVGAEGDQKHRESPALLRYVQRNGYSTHHTVNASDFFT